MHESLFERYREALRVGHVAVVRGHLEEARSAYREAIEIAGDRAVPRTALGGVHLRLGDPAAALEAYDGALALAPDDDDALAGRAQALVVLRRTGEAAAAYDRLADVREADGRRDDAAVAARRALEIEPTDDRRRRRQNLGSSAPEPPAAAPPTPDPEELVAAAEEALRRGDHAEAATAALAAARGHAAAGHTMAAIDACLLGIGANPGGVDLHLALADLGSRGDTADRAFEARRRLLRLAELDGDTGAIDRIHAAMAVAGPAGSQPAPLA